MAASEDPLVSEEANDDSSSLLHEQEGRDESNDETPKSSLIKMIIYSFILNIESKLLLQYFKGWWKTAVIIITPLLLLPIPTVIRNSVSILV